MKGEEAVFLVSLMIGHLNADASVKTKSDDYSFNTLFHPAISSPLPAPQVFVLPKFIGWRPCTLYLLDSISLPSSPLQQEHSAQSSASVLYKPMKESPARCSWRTDVYPIGLQDQSLRHPSKHQASTLQHFSTRRGFPA